jgi:hypothetical protein
MKQISLLSLFCLAALTAWAGGSPDLPDFGGRIPEILLVENTESEADSLAMDNLSEYQTLNYHSIGWKEIKNLDLGDYDLILIPSRMYKKDINGISAYMDRILKAVEEEGTGLLILNNYLNFKDSDVPESWNQADLIKVMPLHSDETPLLPFAKVFHSIDGELEAPSFNTLYPDRDEFSSFVAEHLESVDGSDLLTPYLSSYNKVLKDRLPAFGWFECGTSWRVLVEAETQGKRNRSVLIEREFGKGRILLSTLFTDADVLADRKAVPFYLALIDLCLMKEKL